MKIQTEFDRKIKEVYEIIALPYPPKTLQNGGVSEENFETEENSMELKPFKLKSQSYNIQKDELTVHKTSKQLTRFLTECERHRRESEKVTEKDQSYLKYKENVVNFIESLSSKAKAERAHCDSLNAAKLKETKVEMLSDVRRFSNTIQADKEELDEQQRRIALAHEQRGQEEAINMVNKLMPIHAELTSSLNQKGSSQDKRGEISDRVKNLLNSAEIRAGDAVPTLIDTSVVQGAGQIGRVLKRGSSAFQSKLNQVAEGARRKSSVQAELIFNLAKKAGTAEQGEFSIDKKKKDTMNVVLDSVIHKVTGKQVEKQLDEEVKSVKHGLARQDTLEKINDYGKRKDVLENADISYLTEAVHDAKTKKTRDQIFSKEVRFEDPDQPSAVRPEPIRIKLAKRRPTGPPTAADLRKIPAVKFGQKVAPSVRKPGSGSSGKPGTSAVSSGCTPSTTSPNVGGRKISAPASNTARKTSTPSPNTVRKTSSSKPSPNTARKASTPSPNTVPTVRKTSTSKPSPNTARKASATVPSATRKDPHAKPSEQKPTTSGRWT